MTARFDTIQLEQIAPDRVRISGTVGEPPPATLKVAMNELGGYRNDIAVALTGLDIEAKADTVGEAAFWRACPYGPDDFASVNARVIRTDQPDPSRTRRRPPSGGSPSRTPTNARSVGRSRTPSSKPPWRASPVSTV